MLCNVIVMSYPYYFFNYPNIVILSRGLLFPALPSIVHAKHMQNNIPCVK